MRLVVLHRSDIVLRNSEGAETPHFYFMWMLYSKCIHKYFRNSMSLRTLVYNSFKGCVCGSVSARERERGIARFPTFCSRSHLEILAVLAQRRKLCRHMAPGKLKTVLCQCSLCSRNVFVDEWDHEQRGMYQRPSVARKHHQEDLLLTAQEEERLAQQILAASFRPQTETQELAVRCGDEGDDRIEATDLVSIYFGHFVIRVFKISSWKVTMQTSLLDEAPPAALASDEYPTTPVR